MADDTNGLTISLSGKLVLYLVLASLGGGAVSSVGSKIIYGSHEDHAAARGVAEVGAGFERRLTTTAGRVSNIYGQLGDIKVLLEELKTSYAEQTALHKTAINQQAVRIDRLERALHQLDQKAVP